MGHLGILELLEDPAFVLFSTVAVPTYVPTNSVRSLSFYTSSAASIGCGFFDHDHSDWCEIMSHRNFDLHFSNN